MLKSKKYEVTKDGKYYLTLPEELAEQFLNAGHKRAKVVVSFNGEEIYFHAAIRKIKGLYRMMFSKQHQKQLGMYPSDYFTIQFFEDTTKYGVEMPEELDAVLESDPEFMDIFKSLTDGKKRNLIYTIKRYKNSQTKIDKAILISENLKRGIKDQRQWLKVH
ncbi:MAG: YdeI/OmpD-associated family protein [Patiriisocius sp.]|uniref:YdeI/OmpD-associated family protein n=1 Tax=Patiriisocius sp. TaxID=2822396 RepID=UPI003EF77370